METIITDQTAVKSFSLSFGTAEEKSAAEVLLSYGAMSLAGDMAAKVSKSAASRHEALKEVCVVLGVTPNSWKAAVTANPALKEAQAKVKSLSDSLMAAVMAEDDAKVAELRPLVKAAKVNVEECAKNEKSSRTLSNLALRCSNNGERSGTGGYEFGASKIKAATEDLYSETVRTIEKAASKGAFFGTPLAASLENKNLLDVLTEEDLTPRQYEASEKQISILKERIAKARTENDAEELEKNEKKLLSAQEAHKPLKNAYDKYAAKVKRANATALLAETKAAAAAATAAAAESTDGSEEQKLLIAADKDAQLAYGKAVDAAKKLGIPTE